MSTTLKRRLGRLVSEAEDRARASALAAARAAARAESERGRRAMAYVFAHPELHAALMELDELARGGRPYTDPVTTEQFLGAGETEAGRPHADVIERHAERLLAAAGGAAA